MVLLFTLKLLSFTLSCVHAHTLKDFLTEIYYIWCPQALLRPVLNCDFRKDHLCNAFALKRRKGFN